MYIVQKCLTLPLIMWNLEALIQVKAFARQYGLVLTALWVASFLAIMYAPRTPLGSFLAVASPFLVGYLLVRFRNYALNGVISFRRGLTFSWYTFFYASLLFAVFQYIFFRYLDQGTMMTMLLSSVKALEPIYLENGISKAELDAGVSAIGQLSPIQLAFIFMIQNMFFGMIASFPIAFFARRSNTYRK